MGDMIKGRDLLDALGEIGAPATLSEILKVFNTQYPSIPIKDLKLNLKRALLAGVRFGYLQKEGEYFYSTVGTEEAFLELLKSSEKLNSNDMISTSSTEYEKGNDEVKKTNKTASKTKQKKRGAPCSNPNCQCDYDDDEDDFDDDDEEDELLLAALEQKLDDDDIDEGNQNNSNKDAIINLEEKIEMKDDGKLFVDESKIESGVYFATEQGIKKFMKAVHAQPWTADMPSVPVPILPTTPEESKKPVSKTNKNNGSAQKMKKTVQKKKSLNKKKTARSPSVSDDDDDYDTQISDDDEAPDAVESDDDFLFKPCCSNCCLRRKPRRSKCRRKRSRSRSCRPKRRARSRKRSCSRRRRKRKSC